MGELIDLKIEVLSHGGEGIGRHEKRAIFVPYVIPGEQVRVEIMEEARRFSRARLVEVLEPSPVRVEPPCPYFGICGGCHLQHIDYPAQVQLKALIVLDQLQRIGKFTDPPVLEPIPDDTGWEYRNHIRFHADVDGGLGFLALGGQDIIRIDDCLIAHPLLCQLCASLDLELPGVDWLELRVGAATGDLMVVLQTEDEEPPSLEVDFPLSIVQVCHDGASAPLIGLDYIMESVHGREFRISPTSFYQVNSVQAARLVDLVLEALELEDDEQVLDAYCGVGLFTAFMAEVGGFVTGIELSPDAIADARHNLAGLDNVAILEGKVEALLPTLEQQFDAVIVDPPRGGLELPALDALVASGASRLVYVSCDPATLARDARRLVNGGFTLEWVQPVDLFPQTYHIENVALFAR
ncbi:MAG TPA: 23S rRNA (uracil(1939)-C(5))-methyltransferase RlmD [Chloroflexi bacterium]|nr:23S rRNA (uracil(1939)-C(5))-methyltransferase RlmD [Chloroflexota bacterium]